MIIKTRSYPRAALIGNPSDGYFGKTIAFTFDNFHADVTLYPTEHMEILPARRDISRYESLNELVDQVDQYGYYGGIRLIKASIRKFKAWCDARDIALKEENFTLRYHSDVPAHLGLAGSSAIICAATRALMAFYGVKIPNHQLANLLLSVETEELGIGAGLQDRVALSYQGMIHMDFDKKTMERQGYGNYTPLIPGKQLDYYIAYKVNAAEGTEVVHNDLRFRWEKGDEKVIATMKGFADLTDSFKVALDKNDRHELNRIIDANFDLRASIMNLNSAHVAMIETARKAGASAKFTGSGGAIIGLPSGERGGYERLRYALESLDCIVFRPRIVH